MCEDTQCPSSEKTYRNILMIIKKGLMIIHASNLGKTRKEQELIPMISRASICSVTRMVPISDAILEPTLPANIRLTIVGENSRITESLVVKPTAYIGTHGLVKPKAACIVITAPIKSEIIATMGSELIPRLSISWKNSFL